MDNPKINSTITECRATGTPLRALELQCKIENNSSFPISILDSWIGINGKTGNLLAEGNLFHMRHNLVDLALIEPGKTGSGTIKIPLPPNVLRFVEQQRAGGDVELDIYSRVLVCEVRTNSKPVILGQPHQTQLSENGKIEYKIPQSEWIKHLKMLGWSEIELIEIPAQNIQMKANIKRAFDRFNDATECFRRGMWDETLLNCRKSFEALIKDTSGCDDLGQGLEAIKSVVGNDQKANEIDSVVKSLSAFLHLARHEQFPNVEMHQADAQLALHLTGALLSYLGS